ncbi:MAG: acyl-CoA reductase [Bacteroidia bacterium]|nr:acyl-CoA reductase [Bacteroidia bacterium]
MIYQSFIQLSEILKRYLRHDFNSEYTSYIQNSIQQAEINNPWFIEKFTRVMLSHISDLTSKESIEKYVSDWTPAKKPKNILVIAAGNVPMVSFHDAMTVLLSGHRLMFKPSSKDTVLMEMILNILQKINPSLHNKIIILKSTISLNEINAVIATGTNNTALQIHQYFSKYPRIVRNNRTSLAIIHDTITNDELKKLADDIFLFFGLGCRNVSKIFIPHHFDIQKIFQSLYHYNFVMQHHKYMNNYDYYRSIYLLNKESFLENNFLILKESQQLHAPVANLFYEKYHTLSEVENYISQYQNDIQTIVSSQHTAFGKAQFPDINDFADGINTKEFLINL